MNTIGELLTFNAQQHASSPAFTDGDRTITHREHERGCAALAAGLYASGLKTGDRISLLAYNSLAFVQLLGAAALLGVTVSAINWRLSASEVSQVISNDEPTMVFTDAALAPLLREVQSCGSLRFRTVTIDADVDGFESLRDLIGDSDTAPQIDVSADAPALFIHTAWTDGRPKAAILTHRNLMAGAVQLRDIWKLEPTDVHLCALPLFHITAATLTLATSMAGGCSILQARFDAAEALEDIERCGATVMGEFAPMLDMLLQQRGAADRLATLRHVCGLDTPETIHKFESLSPNATFWSVYGQSEAGGLVSMAPFRQAAGSAGKPLPACSVWIADEYGRSLPSDTLGEIVVRGPTVFAGYWGRKEESAKALRDGLLHTGDAGKIDAQGRLIYSGRLEAKELIKTGGENVYPAEVEQVLRGHPAVADVAVIGVPDLRWGESIRAVCVMHEPTTAQDLIDYVEARIAAYKKPRSVIFVEALPRNVDGSHRRDEIKALFRGET